MTDINTSSKKTHNSNDTSGKAPKQKSPFNNHMEPKFVYNHGIPPPIPDFHTPMPTIMFMHPSQVPKGSSTSKNGSRSDGSDEDESLMTEEMEISPDEQFNQMIPGYAMQPWGQPIQMPMPMMPMVPPNMPGNKIMQPPMFNFLPPMMPDGSYNFMFNPPVNNFTYKGVNNGHSKSVPIVSQHMEKVEDFEDELYEMSKDHQGSRLLQDIMTLDDLALIKFELLDHVKELSIDPFGNYFIQKWIEMIPDIKEKMELVGAIVGFNEGEVPDSSDTDLQDGLLGIAYNSHGTRTLQMAVSELRNDPEGIEFLKAIFEDKITLLSIDLNGNHVVQELLSSLKSENLAFVINQIEKNIVEIVTEKHGCCVAQRALDNGNKKQKEQLCKIILKDTIKFSKDPYGNYVIQYIMQKEKDQNNSKKKKHLNKIKDNKNGSEIHEDYKYSKVIVDHLLSELNELCFHKYGSNVIENAMKLPDRETAEILFEKLVNIFEEGHEKVLSFLTDAYANYVLQTSLLTSQKHTKELNKLENEKTYYHKFVSLLKPVITDELDKLHEKYNIPTEKLLDVEDHGNDSGRPNKDNSIVVDMDDADALKTIQLQRVLGLCEHDYDRNKDKTHYFNWGPNFKTKNHDSLGLEKEKQINRNKTHLQYRGKQGYNNKNHKKPFVYFTSKPEQ